MEKELTLEKEKIFKFLREFLKIPSVSAQKERRKEIFKGANFLKKKLLSLGFKVRLVGEKDFPPLVVGEKFVGGEKTIGIYGHYDVQPEDPLEEWKFPPFDLTIKNGKIYGRGASDNKGKIVQNLVAVEELLKKRALKNNIVFLFEGEEEIGSVHFEKYVQKIKKLLSRVDVFYVTDVGMVARETPTIYYGLRGIVCFEMRIKIGESDLHSGNYGNLALNPIQVVAEIFSQMKDFKKGKILIPNFYKRVRKIPRKEIEILAAAEKSEAEIKKESGLFSLHPINKKFPLISTKIYPSLDINGIYGGYTKEGMKTIIPKEVLVKFSFRLVEYQRPEEIIDLVKKFLKKKIPRGIKWELKVLSASSPFYVELENPYLKETKKILEEVFSNKVVFNRSGGSVPPAEIFQRIFKKPVIVTGFSLPDSHIHAPNENLDIETFFKGIKALTLCYGR